MKENRMAEIEIIAIKKIETEKGDIEKRDWKEITERNETKKSDTEIREQNNGLKKSRIK